MLSNGPGLFGMEELVRKAFVCAGARGHGGVIAGAPTIPPARAAASFQTRNIRSAPERLSRRPGGPPCIANIRGHSVRASSAAGAAPALAHWGQPERRRSAPGYPPGSRRWSAKTLSTSVRDECPLRDPRKRPGSAPRATGRWPAAPRPPRARRRAGHRYWHDSSAWATFVVMRGRGRHLRPEAPTRNSTATSVMAATRHDALCPSPHASTPALKAVTSRELELTRVAHARRLEERRPPADSGTCRRRS